jgi:hypothetical protein
MTGPANETITKEMRVSADRAWDAIRQFGRLDVWFPSMIECRIEGEGAGAWRYLALDGRLGGITDRLVALGGTRSPGCPPALLVLKQDRNAFPTRHHQGTTTKPYGLRSP